MGIEQPPRLDLAGLVLPGPLLEALRHVFRRSNPGCALVGGTALCGFYAGHRKSDDLDLFVRDRLSHKAAILTVRSLEGIGARFESENPTGPYYRAVCRLKDHFFTVDVVEDPNLFRVGRFVKLPDGIIIADLETLLKMKSAALVSRCAEKDLYDLAWILEQVPGMSLKRLVAFGAELDAGLNPESLLISVSGAQLRPEACGFALDPAETPETVHARLEEFRGSLLQSLMLLARRQPVPLLGELIRRLRPRRGRRTKS